MSAISSALEAAQAVERILLLKVTQAGGSSLFEAAGANEEAVARELVATAMQAPWVVVLALLIFPQQMLLGMQRAGRLASFRDKEVDQLLDCNAL